MSDIERNKVKNFGEPSHCPSETAEGCMVVRCFLTPPRWNRVNGGKTVPTEVTRLGNEGGWGEPYLAPYWNLSYIETKKIFTRSRFLGVK